MCYRQPAGLFQVPSREGTRVGFLGRDPAAYAAYVAEILDNPTLASEMSRNAVASALGYRWSMTAARLRRVYADLAARQLVECS